MKKIKTASELIAEVSAPTSVNPLAPQPAVEQTHFEITEFVMEFGGLSYYTEKVNEAGKIQPKSITFYHNKQQFRFTGDTAEELYEALTEMTLKHPDVGFGAVLKVDREVKNPEAGGLKLLLEMVPGSIVKLETWIGSDKLPRQAYSLHKGHVTGAIGFRFRNVRFGKAYSEVEHWEGRA